MRHADILPVFVTGSYLEHTCRRVVDSRFAYRDDTGTIASSFDDPIGCYFMASSATWAARRALACRLLTAATS
jgi:hypothetical protein